MKRLGVWVLATGAIASGVLATACGDDSDTTGAGGGGGSGSGGSGQSSTTTSTTAGPTVSSSATTTSGSSSGGGEGGAGGAECSGAEDPLQTACDVVAQDCADPCRPRCVAYFESDWPASDGTVTACLREGGDATLDEGCTRPNGTVGEDTCAIGFYCAQIARPEDATDERTCHSYCLDAGDCPDQPCIVTSDDSISPDHGYCARTCDPFADACPAGDACTAFTTADGTRQLFCSNQHGDKLAGEACSGVDCGAGLTCADFGGGPRCRAFCDEEHPCDGVGCLAPPGSAGYRVCSTEGVADLFAPFVGTGYVETVAVAADDSFFLTVQHEGDADFLGELVAVDATNLSVLKVSPTGEVLWRITLGAGDLGAFLDVTALADGGAILAGGAGDDVDLGGEVLAAQGEGDALLVRLGPDGSVVWSKRIGGPSSEGIGTPVVAGDRVVVGGTHTGTSNFGGADLVSLTSNDAVLAAYSLADGSHVWSRALPLADSARIDLLDADRFALSLWVPEEGVAFDAVSFGAGAERRVLVDFDVETGLATAGTVLAEGEFRIAFGSEFVVDATGRAVIANAIDGPTTFGGEAPSTPTGVQDAFVVSVTNGALDWLHHPVGTGQEFPFGAAESPAGRIAYLAQIDNGTVDVGDLSLTSSGPGPALRKSWLGVLDGGTGAVERAFDVTVLGTYRRAVFLSDERVVAIGPGGLAVLDLGL